MTTKKCQRVLLSIIALSIVYANVVVLLNWPLKKLKISGLPLPPSAQDPFQIFGVFSYYETTNQELIIWGLAADPNTGATYWKQLPTWNYFPFSRGEQNSRMWAGRQYRILNKDEFWRIWQSMGQRIKERHNRNYPRDPITKVAFESVTWPRDANGFHVRQSSAETTRQSWIIAE